MLPVVFEFDAGFMLSLESRGAGCFPNSLDRVSVDETDNNEKLHCDSASVSYSYRKCIFQMESKPMMNSQYVALLRRSQGDHSRKRKRQKKQEEMAEMDILIESLFSSVMDNARKLKLFLDTPSSNDNNIAVRDLVDSLGCGDMVRNLCRATPNHRVCSQPLVFQSQSDVDKLGDKIFNRLVVNDSCADLIVPINKRQFLLPADCKFIISDVKDLPEIVAEHHDKYNFIVIDPPWKNKSVKRKAVYDTIDNQMLFDLPVTHLSADECLLLVWVTNKKSHKEFLLSELLPHWDFKLLSVWYWCKVTSSGELVSNMGNMGKKPYEPLVLAVRNKATDKYESLRRTRVIISTPSLIHSSKPKLKDVFSKFLSNPVKGLELFARNLISGFTSWGNEVLRLQDLDYFETKYKRKDAS